MTTVALVGPEYEENLSLRYLASSLRAAGFGARIHAFNRERDLPRIVGEIVADPPLAVGLSLAFQWRAKDFLALAMALRQAGHRGHVTAGGHFATFACRELLRDFPELDSICRQESEETIVSVARALADGEPLGAIAGLGLRGHRIAPLVSSRGCYANCTFCCIAAWHEETQPGKRFRLRSAADVADEMVAEQRERGIEIFVFHDDNFFVPGP